MARRKPGKLATYMWNHVGVVVRPRGLGGKMHLEARGKAAVVVLASWVALVGLIIEVACRGL